MVNIIEALSAPGSRKPVTRTAATQLVNRETIQVSENELESQLAAVSLASYAYNVIDEEKPRLLDRWLDTIVAVSGSSPALLATAALIMVWALMGIRYGHSENWQVVISDVQAVFCYIFDSLLMRQQLNSYDRSIRISATFQSRAVSIRRMLRQIKNSDLTTELTAADMNANHISTHSVSTPRESWIGQTISMIGHFFGHMVTLIIFWIGIFVWLAFGSYCGWSVRWQLDINSATSALMMLSFALIACIREQNRVRTSAYLQHICHLDVALECQLREITGDKIPNEAITIYPRKVNRLQRAISYYADLVGTLVGIALLMSVVVVWVAIGPTLHFNSNWWLIIGTYAGLIGMHDGFVLHNIQSQLNRHEEAAMADVARDDTESLSVVGVTPTVPAVPSFAKHSVTEWLSCRLSHICALEYAVIFGIVVVVGLVVTATALKWSVTGQLLCNIPPSIIETFIMMALISSHELDDVRQNQRLGELAVARETLTKWVDEVKVTGTESKKTLGAVTHICLPSPTIEEGGEMRPPPAMIEESEEICLPGTTIEAGGGEREREGEGGRGGEAG